MRTKRILAFVLAFVLMLPAGLANPSMSMEAQAEEYYEEYSYLDRDQMLPYERLYLGSVMNYYHEDAEHPEGEWLEFPVSSVEIIAQYDWGENGEQIPVEEERFFLEKNPGEGWGIYTEEYGSADIEVSYEGKDGKETMECTIYSVNEIYSLNWEFLNGCQFYLKNSEAPVYAVLTKNYRNDENGRNYYNHVIEDFSIEFADESMEVFENDCLTAKIGEDQKSVEIAAKEQEGDTWLEFRAYVHDNGEKYDVCMGGFSIIVAEQFVNILPETMENPGLGETLDFSQVALYYHQGDDIKGQDITDNEDIRMYIDYYDGNAFEPTEELNDNQLPNFTRVSSDGGSICVVAEENVAPDGEEEQWEIIRGRWFNFSGLDYSTWFDDLQNGDHGYVYSGEEQIIHINRENLEDKENYSIQFQVGINVNDEFVPLEDQDGLFEEVKEAGVITGIKLNGEALAARKDEFREGGWFDICVSVFVGEDEVSRDWRGMELREELVDYHYDNWGMSMLPYWDHDIGKNLGYHINNASNPDGMDGEIQISDIRVEIIDGDENVLEVTEWDDGNGWSLHANDFGHAVVTLTHPSATDPDKELEHSFDVWIGEDVWNLELTMSMGTGDIRPGESMDVRADLTRECFTYEDGHHKGDTSQVAYRWGYCDGNPEDLLSYEAEENVLHITANEEAEDGRDTWIWVRAYPVDEEGNILQDEEGNDIEVAYRDFQVGIRECYYTILPVEIDHVVELGETVELTPELVFVSEEGTQTIDDAVFKCEWNPSELELGLENGQVLEPEEDGRSPFGNGTFKVKKLQPWNAGARIFAYVENENGDYEEVFQRWLTTGETSYNVWFEKDRGGEGFTFLFADETEYKLTLNTDALKNEDGSLKDNISIEWTVGQTDTDRNIIKECTLGEEYTLNEDKTEITLNGEKLKENGFEIRLVMEVVVKSNGMPVSEEPYRVNFWIQDDMLQLEDDHDADTLPVWGWYYENDSMGGYVRNTTYPDGENIIFEIRDIETRTTDDGEGEVFEILHDSDGNWHVNPLRFGEAAVTYTLYHESCGEIKVTRTKWVTNEMYRMGLLSSTHTWQMLTNDELEMNISVYRYTSTEDDGYKAELLPSELYDLRFDYNPELITIGEDGKVTSHDWYDMTGIYVEAQVQMLDGENIYTTGNSVELWVTPEYRKPYAEPLYMEPEDVVNVDDLDIYMLHVTEDNREGERFEVDRFEIYPPTQYLELSEDGKTLKLAYEFSDDELPVTFGMDYEVFYDGESSWDYMDIIVCRHNLTEWFVDVEPTNIKDGKEIRWCHNCGMVEERILESMKMAVTDVFTDVYNDWYVSYVQYVYDHQLMTGIKGTTQFQPNANITKAQVAQVLYNMEGQPEVSDKKVFKELKDVYDVEWYANAVAWAYNNNIVTGDLNTKQFNPNADVTREQLALMIYRYAGYKKLDVTASSDLAGLKNAENVSNWAEAGVKWAVGAGLISGIDKAGVKDLAPQGNASRAQVAAILMRFCQTYEE